MRFLLILSLLAWGCDPEDDAADAGADPQPTAEPAPQPTAEPAPQPTAEPAPQPAPEPAPQPTGEPAPQPEPQPTGEPAPQPEPQPAPQPAPEPAPQPAPEPAPQPEGEPEPPVREPLRHRVAAEACDNMRPPGFEGEPIEGAECAQDSDCVDGENGRCTAGRFIYCSYDRCFADADCANGMGGGVCGCEGAAFDDSNVCLGGNCQVDADCGPQGFCSPTFGGCGNYSGVEAYYCHTPDDECIDDADCMDMPEGYCAFAPERGLWACSYSHCVGK